MIDLKLFRIRNSDYIQHFNKYVAVGLINFAFSVSLFYFLIELFDLNYSISFSISWLSGLILTFALNHFWIFKKESSSTLVNRFWKYFISYILSYILNLSLLHVCVSYLHLGPVSAQIFILPFIALINFSTIKYWVMS